MRDILLSLLNLYWKLFKPKTFGVKVIIQHPESGKILLVQHGYGDSNFWHLPGGGYRPQRESAEQAAHREVFEELGIELAGLTYLTGYKTSAEGKRDTVSIFTAVAKTTDLMLGREIQSVDWRSVSTLADKQTYPITRFALEMVHSTI